MTLFCTITSHINDDSWKVIFVLVSTEKNSLSVFMWSWRKGVVKSVSCHRTAEWPDRPSHRDTVPPDAPHEERKHNVDAEQRQDDVVAMVSPCISKQEIQGHHTFWQLPIEGNFVSTRIRPGLQISAPFAPKVNKSANVVVDPPTPTVFVTDGLGQ